MAQAKEGALVGICGLKTFERVAQVVLWWGLRLKEWIENVVESMYTGVTTPVKLKNVVSEQFEVRAGVHQGVHQMMNSNSFAIHHCDGSIVEQLQTRFALGASVCW